MLDAVRGEVIAADGSRTVLRAKTLALLNLLLEHAGQLLSQNEILDRLWPDVTVAPASVTQCISELRQALGAADAEILKTLPRRGYVLAAEVESLPPPMASNAASAEMAQPGATNVLPRQALATAQPALRLATVEGAPVLAGIPLLAESVSGHAIRAGGLVQGLQGAQPHIGPARPRILPRNNYQEQSPQGPEKAQPVSALALLPPLRDDRPSIAVLPFRKNLADPQDAYFADGIVEGIVHVLSGLEQLRVISRGSALTLAERTVDPREVGRELGVRYVLYGGVQRAGDRLRISTELSESEGGTILRADRHEGHLSDIFALQDRIAEQSVTTITPSVREHELQRALRKPPASLTAYDLVLRALDQFWRLDRLSFDQARAFLQEACVADPGSALPYSYLAWWHGMRIAQGWSPATERDNAAAESAVRAAIARDPNDALALAARGYELGYGQRDFAGAEICLDRSIKISPSCALAWCFGAAVRCWTNRAVEAMEWGARAVQLAPHDPFAFMFEHILAQAYYTAGDYDAAIMWCQRSDRANPRHSPNLRTLVASLVAVGRTNETQRLVARIMEIEPQLSLRAFGLRTPLSGAMRDKFISRLQAAGLPD